MLRRGERSETGAPPLHRAARPAVTSNMSLCSRPAPPAGGSCHVAWRAARCSLTVSTNTQCRRDAGGEATVLCQHVVRSSLRLPAAECSCGATLQSLFTLQPPRDAFWFRIHQHVSEQMIFMLGVLRQLPFKTAGSRRPACKTLTQHDTRARINKWIHTNSASMEAAALRLCSFSSCGLSLSLFFSHTSGLVVVMAALIRASDWIQIEIYE